MNAATDPGTAASLSTEALVGPVIDASLDAVVIADLGGRILRVNPAAEAIFGHAPGSMVGRSIGDAIVPVHMRAAHDRGMAHHAATGERKVIGRRLELEALHGDGHHFPVEIQIEEVLQGEQRIYAAFVRDLTERRAMEAEVARQRELIHQQEKLAALGTLLGGVAHELNNPLAVVIGRAAILEDALAGTAEARTVLKLREAANRCHRIVRTFLAMARDTRPRQGEVQLNDLLAGVLEFSGYNLRTAGIAVTTAFDPALGAMRGDYDQLVQAFVGLVLNAQQALEGHDGPRALHVSTASGAAVTIRIEDSGPGIAAEARTRVFEPFFTTKAFGAGGGSGLAVARGIFESHGGMIAIDPAFRSGCAIVVTLPAGEPA
jgi:two-component system NtrC family sensor kinase